MARPTPRLAIAALFATLLAVPSPAAAYGVLAHEALIDQVWQDQLAPLLIQKFPGTSTEALREARAHAYGGSLIQDLGYYPFGSRFFSNLVHYVRTGAFVEALIQESRSVDEYAFALGALAHYTGDVAGHRIGVNRAVPIVYPKLQEKLGQEVLYADSATRHVMVEFAFDVLQAARGTFRSDVYQRLLGFKVATPLLERAFGATYGLQLTDLFADMDLAIGSYRRAASETIPDITRAAWKEKHDEILAASPDLTEQDFLFTLTRQQYEDAFGTSYRKPGFFARVVVAIFKVIPKFGPFKPLAFEPLTPEAERLVLESFATARERYRASLQSLTTGRLELTDADLDTGAPVAHGLNPLADEAYADLLEKLVEPRASAIPPELRTAIGDYYATLGASRPTARAARKEDRKTARNLALLNATAPPAPPPGEERGQ
jgi:hypothetical protein